MSPGTFSKIHIQVVFAVKGRISLISPRWENELYKYISGTISKKDQKMLAVNGAYDHIHILLGMRPTCCLSDLVREIKKSSNQFLKEKGFVDRKFAWQGGFGAFSYAPEQVPNVIAYIRNQKDRHKTRSFREEYIEFLETFEVDYEERFLFEDVDHKGEAEF